MMLLVLAVVFSLAISLIWVYYLRRIDLFEREHTSHLVLVFVMGALSPFLIDVLHILVYRPLGINEDGTWLNDSFFFVFGVGLPEEIVKFLPAFLAVTFFKKARNEALDLIVFSCVSALGFAFHENILYVRDYGLEVLTQRSILSVPAHMFFSALFMYGIVLARFHNTRLGSLNIPLFCLLSVVSHGFYDLMLSEELSMFGAILDLIYFFLMVSFFSTILNNCMNNSAFYSPKKIIDSEKLIKHLALFYLALLVGVLAIRLTEMNFKDALLLALFIKFEVFICGILIVRLSRFKIIPGRWHPIKPEFPFSLYLAEPESGRAFSGIKIRVKGESFNEVHLNAFLEEHLELIPVSRKRTHIGQKRVAYMEKKLFLHRDETFYLLRVILKAEPEQSVFYLLKAKTRGSSRTADGHPIAALLKISDPKKLGDENSTLADFPFLEWVILKPLAA